MTDKAYGKLKQQEEGMAGAEAYYDDDAVPIVEAEVLPPPSGQAPGGTWGSAISLGGDTRCTGIVCCLLFGLVPASIVCCLPFDRQRAYRNKDGAVYGADGILISARSESCGFMAHDQTIGVDCETKTQTMIIAGLAWLAVILIYIFFLYASPQ